MEPTPRHPERGATRRQFVLGSVGALVSLPFLLSACGEDGPAGRGTGSAPAAGGAFPVTIEHKYGSTTVPAPPSRIVVAGYNDQDTALALGASPLAVRFWYGVHPHEVWPWQRPHFASDPEVLPTDLPFERIAALRPDLILDVADAPERADYERLALIAPTVVQTGDFPDWAMPRRERTLMIGRAMGQEATARRLLADLDARFATARADHPEFAGKTASIAIPWEGGNYYVYGPGDARMQFMEELGFGLPPALEGNAGEDEAGIEISRERTDMLEADVVVWIANTGTPAEFESIRRDALYRRLDAVRAGRDLFLEFDLGGAISYDSVLSLPWALDEIVPQVARALASA